MNAQKDQNDVSTKIAVLNTNGSTIVNLKVVAADHELKTADGTGGVNHGGTNAERDENDVPCMIAVSSVDGVTPVPLYADADGNLLVQFI